MLEPVSPATDVMISYVSCGVVCHVQDVGMIGDACRDPSVMVRKQAMTSLTELLKQIPLNKDVHKYLI